MLLFSNTNSISDTKGSKDDGFTIIIPADSSDIYFLSLQNGSLNTQWFP